MTTTTASAASYPLPRERNLILASLLVLAGAAWAVLAWQGAETDEMSLTMGMSAPLFIALWIVMMVAVMFPTAAPMILMFARIYKSKRERGQAFVPTWVFTSAYLLVWSATGIAAYAIAVAGDALADESTWVMDNAPRFGGGLLIMAGVYQLSPLKYVCLNKCRTPMSFILSAWRDGYGGAFRMGIEHGAYCLGCCWLLFLLLFPLGMMNIIVLAAVTALIFAEKSLPVGRQVARAAALALVVYGAVVIFQPDALPMTMDSDAMDMPAMEGELGVEDGMAPGEGEQPMEETSQMSGEEMPANEMGGMDAGEE
jgi:predicted metal-binding membrane protein